uniref:T9SS type A sorting domain-containing protein n=1 Tax=Ignavibacterium album TaxID=591197 RepID=A0A832G8H5_9BACT
MSWQSAVGSLPDGKAGRQIIKLYVVLGRETDTIADGHYEAGKISRIYILHSNLPSGVYFYQLKTENYVDTKKMILHR